MNPTSAVRQQKPRVEIDEVSHSVPTVLSFPARHLRKLTQVSSEFIVSFYNGHARAKVVQERKGILLSWRQPHRADPSRNVVGFEADERNRD